MNRSRLQAILDNPPPKSPYFTLPSVANLIIEPEALPKPKPKRRELINKVTKIWGPAKKMTDKIKTSFLADLLQFSTIDFDAMARDHGIASGKQIRKRLNTIIRKEGYQLEGDRVVSVAAAATAEKETTPTTQGSDAADEANLTDPEVAPTDAVTSAAIPRASKSAREPPTKVTKRKKIDDKAAKERPKKKQKTPVEKSKKAAKS